MIRHAPELLNRLILIIFLFSGTATYGESGDDNVKILCSAHVYDTQGNRLQSDDPYNSCDSGCQLFFSRHRELADKINRVVIIQDDDLPHIESLLRQENIEGRQIFRNESGQDDASTLVIFPEHIRTIKLSDTLSLSKGTALFHATSEPSEQLAIVFTSNEPEAISAKSRQIFVMDGFRVQSTAGVHLVATASNIGIANVDIDSARNRDAGNSVSFMLLQDGKLSIRNSEINCAPGQDTKTCLDIACPGCQGVSLDINDLDLLIALAEEGSGSPVCSDKTGECTLRGLHATGLKNLNLNNINIESDVSITPVRLGFSKIDGEIEGCISNMVVNTRETNSISPVVLHFLNWNAFGNVDFFRNGIQQPSINNSAANFMMLNHSLFARTGVLPKGVQLRDVKQSCYQQSDTEEKIDCSEPEKGWVSSLIIVPSKSLLPTELPTELGSTTEIVEPETSFIVEPTDIVISTSGVATGFTSLIGESVSTSHSRSSNGLSSATESGLIRLSSTIQPGTTAILVMSQPSTLATASAQDISSTRINLPGSRTTSSVTILIHQTPHQESDSDEDDQIYGMKTSDFVLMVVGGAVLITFISAFIVAVIVGGFCDFD